MKAEQSTGNTEGMTTDPYAGRRTTQTPATDTTSTRRSVVPDPTPNLYSRRSAQPDATPDFFTRRSVVPEPTPDLYSRRSVIPDPTPDLYSRRSAQSDSTPDFFTRRSAVPDPTPDFYTSRRNTQPENSPAYYNSRRSTLDSTPEYRRVTDPTQDLYSGLRDYRRPAERRYQPDQYQYYQPESVYGTMRQPRRYQEEPKRNRSTSLNRTTIRPEQSILGRFLAQDLREVSPPEAKKPQQGDVSPNEGLSRRGSRKVSRFLRPDFYDTPREDSMYAKQKDELKREDSILGRQREDSMIGRPRENNVLGRPREEMKRDQRQPSLSRDDDPKSRISRAISSLQQKTTSNNLTESTLIKRAVSSDDCAQMNEQPAKGKVNSVLGMFKKLEKTPDATRNTLSRFRRAQSVYEPSTSSDLFDPDKKKVDVTQRGTPSEENSDGGNQDQDSFDSWSVCSGDTQQGDLAEENDTVGERIRRKSFYTRFNDFVAPKKQPAKASPHVAAILERDLRRGPHKHHHSRKSKDQETNNSDVPSRSSSSNRRLNSYMSMPRGWEPQQAENDYYNQAARSINRYGYASEPITPSFPGLVRRPGQPLSPHLGVDH